MPEPKKTLHHEETDKARVALLLIDVINPLEFDEGQEKPEYNAEALSLMARVIKANIRPSTELDLQTLLKSGRKP